MELLIGDLCDIIIHPFDPSDPTKTKRLCVSPDQYSWRFRMKIAYDIAKGMQYLQNISPPVIHRDLRSPNIFVRLFSFFFKGQNPMYLHVTFSSPF